jgi:hypothetical protein
MSNTPSAPEVLEASRLAWEQGVRELVEKSCEEQGVPVKVTDSAVLGQVAVMLGAGRTPLDIDNLWMT